MVPSNGNKPQGLMTGRNWRLPRRNQAAGPTYDSCLYMEVLPPGPVVICAAFLTSYCIESIQVMIKLSYRNMVPLTYRITEFQNCVSPRVKLAEPPLPGHSPHCFW